MPWFHGGLNHLVQLAVAGLVLGFCGAAAAASPVDMAIVVSFDRSESVDQEDAKIQIDGLIFALKHPKFLAAVQSGRLGRIAVSVVTWSSFGKHDVTLPWTQITTGADAARASAVLLRDLDRQLTAVHGSQTDVAFGIHIATKQLDVLPWETDRQLINMVGDGRSNIGQVAVVDRDVAIARGITINALISAQGSAIRVLSAYFREEVIGGPSAFVQITKNNGDFAQAMLRKMLLEMSQHQAPRQRG